MASKWTSTAGPIQTNRVSQALKDLSWRGKARIELSGIVGGEERRSTLTSLCGPISAECAASIETLGDEFAWAITKDNHKAIIARAVELTEALVLPIDDARRTSEDVAKTEQICKEAETKRADNLTAFLSHFASPEPVAVPDGMMVVTIGLKYDNSDMMTDYFDRHAGVGVCMIAAVVKKQAETERLARSVVARYAELRDLDFSWHTEKWSMGHGNYLDGPYIDLPEDLHGLARHYGQPGGPVTSARWQIQFNRYLGDDFHTFRNYPGTVTESTPVPAAASDVTVTENEEKNGVEIRFPAKPDVSILSALKTHGWRWSRFAKCWYHRRTDEALAFAGELTA